MRVSRLRLASLGLGWLVTLGVILAGTTLMHATGARAPVVPALPALTFGIGLCVAGALIATRYRHQLIGLVFGGPGILLISLALAQRWAIVAERQAVAPGAPFTPQPRTAHDWAAKAPSPRPVRPRNGEIRPWPNVREHNAALPGAAAGPAQAAPVPATKPAPPTPTTLPVSFTVTIRLFHESDIAGKSGLQPGFVMSSLFQWDGRRI